MTVFLYGMREREMILDIFEMCSGQRMMTTYIRPGGVWRDVPDEFDKAVRDFIKIMPSRLDEYESMLTKNILFLERTVGIGPLAKRIVSVMVLPDPFYGPAAKHTIYVKHDHTVDTNSMISTFPPIQPVMFMPATWSVYRKFASR